jgi:HK97 family phage major capsid protein
MIEFDIKAAGTMLITTNYSGGTVGLSSLEQGLTRVQRRKPFLRQLTNTAGTNSKYVVWVEQANPDPGVAGTVAEGAAKPATDFDLVETSQEVRKIAVWIKVSKEMIADIAFIEAEIRTELMELVELKLDEQILSGDNVAPNFKGLVGYATAYAAGTFAGTIPGANRFDVLRTAIAQIAAANFDANYILLNPIDVANMELTKDGEGRYLLPPFLSVDGTNINSVRIIANNGITVDKFFVGDFTKAQLRIREDINIQVGWVNDDFTKNLVTILAEMRACFFVKTNHLTAFVYGDLTDAMAALETP